MSDHVDAIPTHYQRWVVASRPVDKISADNFRIERIATPDLRDGEVLVRNDYIMVNPPALLVMSRGLAKRPPIPLGTTMWSTGVGHVVASRNDRFPAGALVSGALGWAEYAISDGIGLPLQKFPLPEGLPPSVALHVLGASGATAYFGFVELAEPRLGETVLVSAAAGSVGSCVAQLAIASGCTVIGIAGTDEKGEWLRSLGVHHVINYKTTDVAQALRDIAPKGVDIYFDNVGGSTLEAALDNLATRGRVILCGATSQYDSNEPFKGPANYFELVHREGTIRGMHIFHYAARFGEAISRLVPLLASGRLRYREDVLEGIENAPAALLRVFAGENAGTQIVKLSR